MRDNTFEGGYFLYREVLLQSVENKLIELPVNYPVNKAHLLKFSDLIIIDNKITEEKIDNPNKKS